MIADGSRYQSGIGHSHEVGGRKKVEDNITVM